MKQILFGMMILVVTVCFVYRYKSHKYKEISINISQNVKKAFRIAGVILAAWIVVVGVDVLVSSFFNSRNHEWGLKLSVSDVSSKGLTLHLERDDEKNQETLIYGSDFFIQKRTLIGWRKITPKGGYIFTSVAYFLEPEASESWNMNFEGMFGKLPMGIYRIKKTTSEDKREGMKQDLYTTFLIIW